MPGPVAFFFAQLRNRLFAYSSSRAALTVLYCAFSPELEIDVTKLQKDSAELQIDPIKLKIDPAKLEIDPTKLETDSTKLEIDSTKLETDPAELETDPAKLEIDAAKLKIDTVELKKDSTELEIDPIKLEIDPTKLRMDAPSGGNGGFYVPVATRWAPRHPLAGNDAIGAKFGARLWAFSEELVERSLAAGDLAEAPVRRVYPTF